jgi:hypothetical protein
LQNKEISKLIAKLQKYASGRLVLLLFIITTVVYLVIVLYSIPEVVKLAPEMKLFDMSPGGYDAIYAEELLRSIGQTGREIYITLQLPIDFVYPGLFAITYSLMLVWLFGKRIDKKSKLYLLAMVPIFAGLFDYFENFGIILMLRSLPTVDPTVVLISSFFSIAKSVFTVVFYILLLFGLLLLLVKRKTTKQPTNA